MGQEKPWYLQVPGAPNMNPLGQDAGGGQVKKTPKRKSSSQDDDEFLRQMMMTPEQRQAEFMQQQKQQQDFNWYSQAPGGMFNTQRVSKPTQVTQINGPRTVTGMSWEGQDSGAPVGGWQKDQTGQFSRGASGANILSAVGRRVNRQAPGREGVQGWQDLPAQGPAPGPAAQEAAPRTASFAPTNPIDAQVAQISQQISSNPTGGDKRDLWDMFMGGVGKLQGMGGMNPNNLTGTPQAMYLAQRDALGGQGTRPGSQMSYFNQEDKDTDEYRKALAQYGSQIGQPSANETAYSQMLNDVLNQRRQSLSPGNQAALRDKYMGLNKGALTDAAQEAAKGIGRAYGGSAGYLNPAGQAAAMADLQMKTARGVGELGMNYDLQTEQNNQQLLDRLTTAAMGATQQERENEQRNIGNRRGWLSDYSNLQNQLERIRTGRQNAVDDRLNRQMSVLGLLRNASGY